MKKWKWFGISVVIVGLIVTSFLLYFKPWEVRAESEELEVSLPRIDIVLNGVTLEEINVGEKGVVYEGESLSITINEITSQYEDVSIKGRGNSTWSQAKKPYQIKLDSKNDLLGLGKSRNWILLTNIFDDSVLRNDTAFFIEKMLDERYALNGEYVELYVDNEYVGLYYLTPKVEIGKDRVDLRDPLGVVVELDNLHNVDKKCYRSLGGDCFMASDLVSKDNEFAAMNLFVDSINQLEAAVFDGDFEKVKTIIDVESFAQYYLISEFTVNPDSYVTSYFFYKDGENDLVHAGPGWDFDFALGNKQWGFGYTEDFYSPYNTRYQERYAFGGKVLNIESNEYEDTEADLKISRLIYKLLDFPDFKEKVDVIFREKMSGRKDELLNYIDDRADFVREAVRADSEKWGKGNFEEEVEYLKDWVSRRFDHFEYEYGGWKYLNRFLVEI